MTSQQPAIKPPIIPRRVTIDFESAPAAGWHLGSQGVEDVLNAMSYVFPPGEKFFIESVQNYRDKITDPVLKEQVKNFIYQEAMHSKEHDRSNQVISKTRPDGHKIERFAEASLNFGRRFFPKATQLAVTTALEHFTAMLAAGLLEHQEWIIKESDPAFASLWLWHAVEESEHKAVCFDVYQQVVGKGPIAYLHRIIVMAGTTLYFAASLAFGFRMIRKRKAANGAKRAQPVPKTNPPTPEPGDTPTLKLLMKDVSTKLYFDYYRPSFHPWNHDNTAQIEEWKRRYKDFGIRPDANASRQAS